jgi:hypothetical protein
MQTHQQEARLAIRRLRSCTKDFSPPAEAGTKLIDPEQIKGLIDEPAQEM